MVTQIFERRLACDQRSLLGSKAAADISLSLVTSYEPTLLMKK